MLQKDTTIIHCKRVFKHPVKKVFDAFLNPLHIKEWFGPKECTIGQVMLSPVVGGNLTIEMISTTGVLWVNGIFREIVLHKKISYEYHYVPDTSGLGESLVTLYFSGNEIETEIELVQEIYKSINAEGRSGGWEGGFDKLEIFLNTR
ncbi:MAG: SRPBCC domain-containing protein [Ginsengibacter sp.]